MKKVLLGVVALSMLGITAVSAATTKVNAAVFSAEQKTAIEQIVKKYLIANPEIIRESIENLQKKQQEEMQKQAKVSLEKNKDLLFKDVNAPFEGKADASVVVVEFFDYQCGYCRKVYADVKKLLENDKDVKVIYREMPIMGELSIVASKAALAANMQGKYAELHNAFMEAKEHFNEEKIYEMAKNVGLDVEKLKTDMQSKQVQDEIMLSQKLFTDMGLRGTPAFVIGNEIIPGAIDYDSMQGLISSLRKK